MPNLSAGTPRPQSPPRSMFVPPPGPPPQSTYAPPPGPPPNRPTSAPSPNPAWAPSPTPTLSEPLPPYTPAADVRHGEIPLRTGLRRVYAPEWMDVEERDCDGESFRWRWGKRGLVAKSGSITNLVRDQLQVLGRVLGGVPGALPLGGCGCGGGGGALRPPPRHPSGSQLGSTPSLGRSNTMGSRPPPGPPTTEPTPVRALLNRGR
ncbi:hypothetical protein FRC07_007113, partial [Ceratobasidium sp. 392]